MSRGVFQTYTVYDLKTGQTVLEGAFRDQIMKVLEMREATFYDVVGHKRVFRQRYEISPDAVASDMRAMNAEEKKRFGVAWRTACKRIATACGVTLAWLKEVNGC